MRLLVAVVVLCAACAAPDDPTEQARQAIYGGTPSTDDEAVFMIFRDGSWCSSTLIAPRTLITAQHCVPTMPTRAANTPNSATADVLEVRTYSGWKQDAGAADLALVLLDRELPVKPAQWNWWSRPVRAELGRIRHVGYGLTETGQLGIRHQVTIDIQGTLNDTQNGFGVATGGPGQGICNGDSGGAAFLVPADGGPESLLGVHSYGSGACGVGDGVSILLPTYREFVEDWLRTHEDAGCPRDDRCVPGCAPVDPDCACAADGFCTSACEDLLDPDCSPFCRADGVCSVEPCPRLDDDCHAPGSPCLRPSQCPGRECAGDPQNVSTYCTQRCAGGACPSGYQCDPARDLCIKRQLPWVENGGACTEGVNLCRDYSRCLDGVCRALCSSNLECLRSERCRAEAPRICVARPPVVLGSAEEARGPLAQGQGCAAAAGAPLLMLLAALLRRVTCRPPWRRSSR